MKNKKSTLLLSQNGYSLFLFTSRTLLILLLVVIVGTANEAHATRLKDIASVKGVRNNQLIGYGIVVGLDGTGDGNNTSFTTDGLVNIMKNMGVKVDRDKIRVKNVASVMVTAKLPPFVKIGQTIDVTISSLGDASSLQGGTLLATSLKGLNNQVYAIAQGPVSIGGFEEAGGAIEGRQKNHLTVARIPSGASVEREVPVSFADKDSITISLDTPDFTTISRMVKAINGFLGGQNAKAVDGATVDITIPDNFHNQQIAFLAAIENLEIVPDAPAKVVLDERTGTVVMGEKVRIKSLALSHGNLSLQVTAAPRPQATAEQGQTPAGEASASELIAPSKGEKLVTLEEGATLGEVVRALNSVGVAPRDLIAIFQSIKASGALQAELEIL